MKRNWWLYASVGGILLSLATLFLPVLRYVTSAGREYSFNVVRIIRQPDVLISAVFGEYTGSFLTDSTLSEATARVMAVAFIGLAAIGLAAVGIATLSKQRRNVAPYILALLGLLGTAVPAAILFTLYILSGSSFMGTIRIGAYPVVTPIAMLLSVLAVTWKRRATIEELRAQEESRLYLYDPGRHP